MFQEGAITCCFGGGITTIVDYWTKSGLGRSGQNTTCVTTSSDNLGRKINSSKYGVASYF